MDCCSMSRNSRSVSHYAIDNPFLYLIYLMTFQFIVGFLTLNVDNLSSSIINHEFCQLYNRRTGKEIQTFGCS